MAVLGINPLLFLTTEDSFERSLLLEVARRMWKYEQLKQQSLAAEIANAVGKIFGG